MEQYIMAGGRRLRCGFTTGTCAALAAAACTEYLLSGRWSDSVSLITPKGIKVEVKPENCTFDGVTASCSVRKDGGDDIDSTHGALITASVSLNNDEIKIDGGDGVGIVTKGGLSCEVGSPAINPVPRRMIEEAVQDRLDAFDYNGGASVIISVPNGAEIAKSTFNGQLGIEGGISILGTSGIVEPMSDRAIIETTLLELRQHSLGSKAVVLTPGNYGTDYIKNSGLIEGVPVVKCSNFIGDALDNARLCGFEEILIVSHIGKAVKLAGGVMNTHSKTADCRAEIFCACSAINGASTELCRAIMNSTTTDAIVELLKENDMLEAVMKTVLDRADFHVSRRAGEGVTAGVHMFSSLHGFLGETPTAKELIAKWKTRFMR